MNPRVERALVYGRAIGFEVRAERLTFMAGSIAYGAFVSLLPLFILVLTAVSVTGNGTLRDSVIRLIQTVLTPGASDVIVAELETSSQLTGLSIVGVLILIWGTLRIFRGLDTAFSDIYESQAANTFTDQVSDGIVVLVVVCFTVVAAALIASLLSSVGGSVGWVLHRGVLILALVATLYPMYYIFPDEDVTYLEVVPGTIAAAVGLAIFEGLFRIYVAFSSQSADSSVIAGVLVLLTWLYFSGLVILFGAVVNAVLSNRSQDVNVPPLFGGINPNEKAQLPDRGEISYALEQVTRLIDSSDEDIQIRVGDSHVMVPHPEKVVFDTNENKFLPDGPVRLELRWSSWPDSPEK